MQKCHRVTSTVLSSFFSFLGIDFYLLATDFCTFFVIFGPNLLQNWSRCPLLASLGLRFGLRPRSRDPLGGRPGRRTRSRDPLRTFLKPLGAKNAIVNISLVLPSNFEPWRTLADPGPPKKAPHGPDRFRGAPPRRLQGRSPENTKAPGRPLGRQILVSEPSLANPRNYKDENYKKTLFFQKSLECLFL